MPDQNPTPEQLAQRAKADSDANAIKNLMAFGSSTFQQNTAGDPRSYSPSEQGHVLAEGDYNPNVMLTGIERDRALKAGENNIRMKAYADQKIDETGKAIFPPSHNQSYIAPSASENQADAYKKNRALLRTTQQYMGRNR